MLPVGDRWQGLGTTIEGVVVVPNEHLGRQLWQQIRMLTLAFEQRFSRFVPNSELSRVNQRAGGKMSISPQMLDLVQTARMIYDQTNGFIDPAIGAALTAAGYDASFDALPPKNSAPRPTLPTASATFSLVKIDVAGKTVTVPNGVQLDFGGIGKGYLADTMASVVEPITKHYWLSFGGDILVSGRDPAGHPWSIAVQDQTDLERDWATVTMPDGRWGIATSGITRRRGVREGQAWHHIINPRTGRPSASDVIAATVIAPTTLAADVAAKVIVLMGADEGLAWIRRQKHHEALAITAHRDPKMTSGMQQLLTVL